MSEPKTIYQAMSAILEDIKPVAKDRKADMGNAGKYNFRGIDDMYNALHEAFAKHKVFILPEIIEEKSEILEKEKTYNGQVSKTYSKYVTLRVKYTFFAEDGTFVNAIGIGEAIDTSDKATNKAQSSALKYVLMQTFLIPTEEGKDVENDNNQLSDKRVSTQQQWNATNTIWLEQKQFEHLLDLIEKKENLEGAKASIAKFSGSIIEGVKYSMKKEYKQKLESALNA